MFFASKIVCAGIVFLSMTTWISGPSPTPPAAPTKPGEETSDDLRGNDVSDSNSVNDVKTMQQTLQDEGQYRGKIDGVLGLRSRASIRGFQKVENLRITGELDVETAGKLGVRPEVRDEAGSETIQDKPSAGIQWTNGSRQIRRMPRKPVRK